MPPAKIPDTVSYTKVRGECRYTYNRLSNDPHAQHLAQPFQEILAEGDSLYRRELSLQDDETHADALVAAADDQLDDIVDELDSQIDIIDKDPKSSLRQRYFRGKTPSAFRRPTLGPQLADMDALPESLMSSHHEALQDIGRRLVPLLKAAHDAVAEKRRAVQARRDFREMNERPQYFEKVNVLRYNTYAALVELRAERPELNLPKKYPDRFFKSRSKPQPTEASLRADLKAAQETVTKIEAALDELLNANSEKEKARLKKEEAEKEAKRTKLLQELKKLDAN